MGTKTLGTRVFIKNSSFSRHMRNEHLNYRRTIDNTLLINRFRSHELNAQLTENALVLPETVGFKAEAVDEEGIWRPCTVKDVSNDP